MKNHLLLAPLLALLALFALLPAQASAGAVPASPPAAFSPDACMFELPFGVIEGQDVTCGYASVPLKHDDPSGPTIQLAVVILDSPSANPQSDPLFIAQGGPGGSTIDTYAQVLLSGSRLLAERDIVLFDQRGALYSQPDLMCEEVDQLILDTLEKDLPDEQAEQMEIEAMQKCRQRLIQEGIDLSAFDSLENAADIDALRRALGYEQINLYGVSYGTLLALHSMRQNPEMLRSVILDAVVPAQTNFVLEVPQTTQRAFNRLFQACAADPDCDAAYPDLERVLFDLVGDLNADPARAPMTDPDSGITYQVVVDGDTFQDGLFQMLYAGSLIPALPRMIYDASDGNFKFFSRVMPLLLFDRTFSYGMYYSVLCAEDADFDLDEMNLDGVHPQIAELDRDSAELFLEICRLWDVNPLGPQVDQPVYSQTPTLVLSGEFDPITPPAYGQSAAESLPNSFVYVFPAGGHGQALESECQDSIILAFLDDPTQPPDASCISELDAPRFYNPANLLDLPILASLLNLEGSAAVEFLILAANLFMLLSTLLVFPLIWLYQHLRRKQTPQTSNDPAHGLQFLPTSSSPSPPAPWLLKLAPWLAALYGPLLLTFLVGLFLVVLEMVLENDSRLFFGVAASTRGWFTLPPLAALISLGMALICCLLWIRRRWNVWLRLYYSLLTFAALVSTIILFKWGLLSALI